MPVQNTMFTQKSMITVKKVYIFRDDSITNDACEYYFENSQDVEPNIQVVNNVAKQQANSVFLHWLKRLEQSDYDCGFKLITQSVNHKIAINKLQEGDTISVPNRYVLHLPVEWYGILLAKGVEILIDHSYECDAFWYFGRLFKYLKKQGVLPNKNLKLLIGSAIKNRELLPKLEKEFGCTIIDTDFFRMYEAWYQSGQFYDDAHFPLKLPAKFDPVNLDRPKSHTFLNMNRYCKPSRYALTEYCRLKGYDKDAIITARWSIEDLPAEAEFDANVQHFLNDYNVGAKWFYELAGDLGINTFTIQENLKKYYPMLQDENLQSIYQTDRHNNMEWYHQTFFSLVSESYFDDYLVGHTGVSDLEVDPYDILFVTEKTYKPIYCGHPFLIVGQAGTLSHLKSLGFETFDNIFDETYDTIKDRHLRFKAICEQLDNFEMDLHYDHITKEKIIHNRNVMMSVPKVKKITKTLLERIGWL